MKYFIFIAAFMLAGCQSVPERQYDPRAKWLSDFADAQVMEAQAGKITYTQAVVNTRKHRDVIYNSAPIHPVDESYFAYLGEMAKKLDAKEISFEQAAADVALRRQEVNAYFDESLKQASNKQSKERVGKFFEGFFAVGAVTLGAMAVAEQNRPVYVPPAPPQSFTCTSYRNGRYETTTCR